MEVVGDRARSRGEAKCRKEFGRGKRWVKGRAVGERIEWRVRTGKQGAGGVGWSKGGDRTGKQGAGGGGTEQGWKQNGKAGGGRWGNGARGGSERESRGRAVGDRG